MTTILDKIVATKKGEIQAAKERRPESELRTAVENAPAVRCFFDALLPEGRIKLIAEVGSGVTTGPETAVVSEIAATHQKTKHQVGHLIQKMFSRFESVFT